MRAVEWPGALSWWSWSARSVSVNATVTQDTSSVNTLTADWLAPRECSRMHSKVSSDWLPSYTKATPPVLEIFKMVAYFPDTPRIFQKLPSTWLVNKLLLQFHYSVYKIMPVDLILSQFSPPPRLQTQFSISSTTLIRSSRTLYFNSIFRVQKQSHFTSFAFFTIHTSPRS